MKREDVLRLFIVQKSEVLFLQPAARCARFVPHLHVERDLPVGAAWRRN
jgi:hypothetical protein